MIARILSLAARAVALVLLASVGSVLTLRFVRPPTWSFLVQSRVDTRAEGARVENHWVPLERVSPHLVRAVIAAEDQTFAHHHGFDVRSIADALDEYADGGRLRGASTLTQQVAKNLYLWQGGGWARKGLEAYFTVLLEALWPKRRILEVYLNVAQFGPGVFGAEASSRRYFGKTARELEPAEAALLAAVLPSPTRLRVASPSPFVEERRAWILEQMPHVPLTASLRP